MWKPVAVLVLSVVLGIGLYQDITSSMHGTTTTGPGPISAQVQ